MRAEASAWILRFAPLVPAGGPVLDLACGAGRHARVFLAAGHPVTAVDRNLAEIRDLEANPDLRILEADLETGDPGEEWPCGDARFAAVVVTNYLWRPLMPRILAAVDAGGLLLYETFAVGNERFGKPSNPDFLLRPDELLELCRRELSVVAFEQGLDQTGGRPRVVQRICARRVAQQPGEPNDLCPTDGSIRP